jgi:hypothetical protein
MIKIRPGPSLLWSTYREAVESYTARQLSNEGDAIDAFSGLLHTLYSGRCIEGIPKPIFSVALLWQPRERLRRRKEFPSWSWVGWKGRKHWLGLDFLRSFEGESVSEADAIGAWSKANTWIVWHSASSKNCRSSAFRTDGPPWLLGSAPEQALHEERFPGLARNITPNPTRMPDILRPSLGYSHDLRYLQFWTVSMHFCLELEATAVLRYTSFEPENTGNGLRRFTLRDTTARQCGWVLLDEDWIEPVVSGSVKSREFILLSETGQRKRPNASPDATQPPCREYNAMMINWNDGIAERAGLGEVVVDASMSGEMAWKEILLG